MLICHCLGITDRDIRRAADAGARTATDVASRIGAGNFCGGCRLAIEELLNGSARPRSVGAPPPVQSGC